MDDRRGFDRRAAIDRVIAARIARLSPACRRLLALASVLGRELDAEALKRLAGPEARLLPDLVREARSAGVMAEVPEEPRRLRFAHALVRDACYAALHPAVRSRLHRRAAGVLEGTFPERHAEIAHHLAAGGFQGGRLPAAERLLLAGDGALRSLAFEEAARLCRWGLEVLGAPRDRAAERVRGRLLRVLEDALAGAGAPAGTPLHHREPLLHAPPSRRPQPGGRRPEGGRDDADR